MRRLLPLVALLAAPLAVTAQGAKLPDARTLGWQVRPDRTTADLAKLEFVEMKPGWHVTTGPVAAIFYRPEMTALGEFTATTKIHFFQPPTEMLEGYGLLVGGKDLVGATQRYLYFLVRNDGRFTVRQRNGAIAGDVVPWTEAASIRQWKAGGEASVANTLSVDAGKDEVRFLVNDVVVATRPRAGLPVDGVVGLRLNHFVNVHVSDLTVTPKGR